MSLAIRFGHARRMLRRARRALWSAIRGPEPVIVGPSTADWHEADPTHPSMLCRCYDGKPAGTMADHLTNCAWLAAMCTACAGEGRCQRCGGDGIEPETAGLARAAAATASSS